MREFIRFWIQIQEVVKIRDAVLEHALNEKTERLNNLKKAADEIFVRGEGLPVILCNALRRYPMRP
jgi:hypothetical protein